MEEGDTPEDAEAAMEEALVQADEILRVPPVDYSDTSEAGSWL